MVTYSVPTSPVDVASDIVATLRDIVKFGTDRNMRRLPGIVARATALAPVVASIAPTACRACAERHSESCGLRNPQPIARDAAIATMIERVTEMIPDATLRGYAVDGETKRIDALYTCTCAATRAPRATSTAPRAASVGTVGTVHCSVDNREHPTMFHMSFGDASTTIALPLDRNDHAAIVVATAAIADWVTAQPGTTAGQRNAATKKLRAYGFYTTAAGYADWLASNH